MKLSTFKMELAMADKCMTINDIAEAAGMKRQVITAIINGRRNPKPATIGIIARGLGVRVTDIIKKEDDINE